MFLGTFLTAFNSAKVDHYLTINNYPKQPETKNFPIKLSHWAASLMACRSSEVSSRIALMMQIAPASKIVDDVSRFRPM